MLKKLATLSALAVLSLSGAIRPNFSPNGGNVDCPVSVTITDANPRATIFFTTDGTVPSSSSKQYTAPITVNRGETIRAMAVDRLGSSPVADAVFRCANSLDSFSITIQVGNDDARSDSAVTATLSTTSGAKETWCLKPSNNGAFSPCPQDHTGITWGNFNIVPPPPRDVNPHHWKSGATEAKDFSTLTITLMEFPGFGKGDDNWDIQSLKLDASSGPSGTSMTLLSVKGKTPPGNGTCFARFKHPNGSKTSSVVFHIDRSIPDKVLDDDGTHNAPYCKE